MGRPFDGSHQWWREELQQIASIVHSIHPEGGSWQTCPMGSCTRIRSVIEETQRRERQMKLSDVQLAQIGLEACVRTDAEAVGVFPCEFKPWDELSSEDMECLTTFSTAIREAIDGEREKEEANRFAEAVETIFRKMTINSPQDAAAWYRIKEWLESRESAAS